jgi:hypothetical protein
VLTATGVRRLVIDETALRPLPSSVTGGVTLTRPFVVEDGEGRALDAVAADPGLAEHFTASDDVLGAHHLLADLAVLQRDLPGVQRGVVVRPPPGWSPSEPFLSTALANLGASPLLEPVTIEDLFAGVEPIVDDGEPVVRTFADVEPARFGPSGASLDRARAAIDGFASLAGGENPEVDLLDRLVLVGAHRALSRSRANAYVDAAIERVRTASANVQVLGDRTYRLTAREGTIPLTLLNANAFDVSVTVSLSSDKLEFARDAVDRIDIEANGTTTQAVPVKALTSGTFGLGVVVRSPDGRLELARSRFTITSTVASGVGIVLSAGAAAFLLLWWGSHWRTVRRARRLVPPEQPLDQPE